VHRPPIASEVAGAHLPGEFAVLYPENDEAYQASFTSDDPTGRRRRKVIDDPYLHRIQRKHFIIFDVLPMLGTLLAIGLLPFHPLGAVDIGVAVVMWMLTGFGISVGYHRLFAHASFKTVGWVGALLAVFGAMAGQGGLISWVAMHRMHHEFGDHEGDVHSPNLNGSGFINKLRGFAHAHLIWMAAHPYPNVAHYAPDLLRNRTLAYISRRYYRWNLLGFIVPSIVCAVLT
jgi:stearoyl-CoA desaturase (delta-9 desaturase)